MHFALPLIAAFLMGCAAEPLTPEEPWLVCIRTADSLECVAKMDGETRRISIPGRGDDWRYAEPKEGT